MLSNYRKEIDKIDEQILDLFLKRLELVSKILKEKKENNIKIKDSKREEEVFLNIRKNLKEKSCEEYLKYSEELFKKIIDISVNFQKNKK